MIASEQGIDYVQKNMPRKTHHGLGGRRRRRVDLALLYCSRDIGDAGDLAYGEKV